MKGKSKSSKRNLGLATTLFLCSLAFLAGLFTSTFFSQDVPIIKPKLRKLEVVHVEGDKYRDLMPIGETGESSIDSIPFQVLSWKPRAYYFPDFATAEQCEHIIGMAKLNLKPSTLALRKGETEESTKGTRTSSGTFISASEDESRTLDLIEKKIAKVTSIPQSHGEAFNVLRYEIGQKYDSHYDAFNPAEYGPQSSQRVASFLLYLSDVEEGGETMFPFENGMSVEGYDYRQCVGLKVKPRRGDGLLFYSLFLNGTIDPTSLHGSCPVIKGEKWVATKWIRDQQQFD
ncbi:Prolyl 4-hydroxylase subunit alpha-1 [Gossypium arboreum]|uniref:procollagen-proline 4-dioxygenase n=1 Tax=Gossypium arboreum TaxID=29729 RepID=A0A0B0NR72_GOSAR|nr:probable prolyl 4-hydroxylase 9 [Gossypium arboreum]KHG15290.1 Prolyl 4-hydroxylase subunit alpha-1 [Gossypium arboreum]